MRFFNFPRQICRVSNFVEYRFVLKFCRIPQMSCLFFNLINPLCHCRKYHKNIENPREAYCTYFVRQSKGLNSLKHVHCAYIQSLSTHCSWSHFFPFLISQPFSQPLLSANRIQFLITSLASDFHTLSLFRYRWFLERKWIFFISSPITFISFNI